MSERVEDEVPQVECLGCRKKYKLSWEEWASPANPQTLFHQSCPSAGVYGMHLRCPHCGYEVEL